MLDNCFAFNKLSVLSRRPICLLRRFPHGRGIYFKIKGVNDIFLSGFLANYLHLLFRRLQRTSRGLLPLESNFFSCSNFIHPLYVIRGLLPLLIKSE